MTVKSVEKCVQTGYLSERSMQPVDGSGRDPIMNLLSYCALFIG